MLVVALLTDYKTDPKLSIAEIERDFTPVFDHINDKHMIEVGDPRRPTAQRVQQLNGGIVYNNFRKNRSEQTLENLLENVYEIPRRLPRS